MSSIFSLNTNTYTILLTSVIKLSLGEDQCEWPRMTRMTGADCAVICNLIFTPTHTHTSLLGRINASGIE